MLDTTDLDPQATLASAARTVRRRRESELDDLLLASHWAALHGEDPRQGPDGERRSYGNRLVTVGGEGSPRVQEFCIGELAIAREVHPVSCEHTIADALDLQHRLPRTWERVVALEAEAWVARRVARMTRQLPLAAMGLVDRAVARAIAGQAPSRVLAICEAKVIEADPQAHQAKVDAEQRRRYVSLSRTDAHGLRMVIARVTAGDAVWVDAMVQRVADILAAQHPDAHRDELRSLAFGWLARPAELLQLLLEHVDDAPSSGEGQSDPKEQSVSEEASDTADAQPPTRALAFPADLLEALGRMNAEKLRPSATLHLHLHEAAVAGTTAGVARVEEIGPVLLAQLIDLVGHAHVTVKPVVDLADRVTVNAYEMPEAVRERTWLRHACADYFPHATGVRRGLDADHPEPYDPHGPPGQTGVHNAAPLGRRHHRWKTHAGYTARQVGDCRYVWRTPHGQFRLVDHLGTHHLDHDQGEMMLDAPTGVDLYFADIELDVDPAGQV
ncbi:hypothetical protein [Nocardioides sp.]|uniref:hypothetical protein n=1 Tax=Nocardioides sp. TaxID=35761 RepID=UPI00273600BB|nr:hypothetical protein [Nocardioides sp.]MDP3893752.1 hypothetical protein [Nocardioides sp.]